MICGTCHTHSFNIVQTLPSPETKCKLFSPNLALPHLGHDLNAWVARVTSQKSPMSNPENIVSRSSALAQTYFLDRSQQGKLQPIFL